MLIFQIENLKIERCIAVSAFFSWHLIQGSIILFLAIRPDGQRTGQWNWYRSSSCTPSNVSTMFHLDRERRFYYRIWLFNFGQKVGVFEFSPILSRRVRESNCKHAIVFIHLCFCTCTGQCLLISSPSSQWFTRYDSMIDCPFHGWPSSCAGLTH